VSPIKSASERVSVGVEGLDKLIEGGLVRGSTYLVAGQTGTGKTIFSMQFLYDGLKRGETCLYLTIEQQVEEILQDMRKFSWGSLLETYIQSGKLVVVSIDPSSISDLQEATLQYISKFKPTRLVLDSLTVAAFSWKVSSMDMGKLRNEIFGYMRAIENTGVTSILITEVPEGDEKKISRLGFEEFIADGIIILRYITLGQTVNRTIEVRKMRRTKITGGMHSLDITNDGVKVSA
jgi:KaiC/GvpD/RAD55 family RecA-like ATPase